MTITAAEPAALSPRPSQDEAVARLRRLVRQNTLRLRAVLLGEAVGLAVSAPLAYLWLVFFLDTRLHLSPAGRVFASLGLLAGVGWAVAHLVRRWHALHLTEDQVALAIERRTPGGVQNRLINAVQLARRGGATADMSAAVVQENYEVLRQLHLEQAARLRPALVRIGLAAGLIAVGVGFWLWQPASFANAASRIFLPLASIEPLYRTTLVVEPGDVEARGDVPLRVTITGERPATLTLLRVQQGKRVSEAIPVPEGDDAVTYTLRDVTDSLDYAVQGGDYTSPVYHVTVPRKASFSRLRVTYQPPAYTGLPERTADSADGNLEALHGTRARLVFAFDQPVASATLLLDRPASARQPASRVPLEAAGEREFAGEVVLEDLLGYRLETVQTGHPAVRHGPFGVRLLQDQPPKLGLTGLERRTEVQVDAVLPLRITATDDYGLAEAGLFARRATADAKAPAADDSWQPVARWPAGKKATFEQGYDLAVASLQAAEGDRIELAPRAVDTDPARNGAWTTGPVSELVVGGEGVALQLQYEQLLRTEGEIQGLIRAEQELAGKVAQWLRKLDGDGGLRWDDAKNLDALHAAVQALGREQEQLRQTTAVTARAMLPQAGNLRLAVGMLADTEMVRTLRILDSVAAREQLPAKRAALADARLTQDRIGRSLQEIQEQYSGFRADWELAHMIPFTKMLAAREGRLRDQSGGHAGHPPAARADEYHRASMARRQAKVVELSRLIQPAFTGLASRLKDQEAGVARAFEAGAATLAGEGLQQPLRQATEDARAGRWREAARQQALAADVLTKLHQQLREAQAEAARKTLAALKERAKSNLDAQKELDKLAPGTAEAFVKDFPDKLTLADTIRMRDVAAGKKGGLAPGEKPETVEDPLLDILDQVKARLELKEDSGVRQDTNALSLAKTPNAAMELKLSKDRGWNKVKPFIQEEFDDLVGKLLDETEDLTKNYETLTLSTNQNNNDPGDVGKNGGTINSTGAVAATGNQKPPSLNVGGVARTGRQGARAYGMVADDEGVDRRGRDKAQEGHEQVADQAGTIKLKPSEDMQKDTSTGVGGKKIQSDDSHFSVADAGKWKDEMARRLEKPQQKNYLVERQGDKLDPAVAAQLRDLTSKQEQVIERIKAIKKELRNLYLPTDHLDELAAALEANLEGLKERPDAELFRLQAQTLDRLRGAARVFQGAGAALEPSLPRERHVRGRVLDEPAAPSLPGYEDAVKNYYLKLANQ